MMNSLSNNCMMIPHKPFVNNDICFISKLEDVPSFSFHIPSPFLHYEDEAVLFQDLQNHLELQQQQSLTAENTVADTLINMADSSTKDVANDGSKQGCRKECNSSSAAAAAAAAEQIPRKKTCKKDRHSKINTAHGPRDRRMRLSLDVARKFFDLQDLLGFDKASKTVEWLLTKSRSAIKELSRGLPQMRSSCTVVGANSGASSTSECEVISGVDESAINENQQMLSKVKPSCTKEKKKIKAARRIPYHPLAKQSREKARERARERTKIRKLGEAKLHIAAIDLELNRLGSWSSSLDQTGDESGTKDYIKNPSSNNEMLIKEVEELSRHERQLAATAENLVHDSMVVGGNWSPSALFNFQLNAGVSTHVPHYMDLQFYCKSSEAYSNINLCG